MAVDSVHSGQPVEPGGQAEFKEELFVVEENGLRTGPEIFVGPLWDITPDGERFVMVLPNTGFDAGSRVPQINVVINWFEELKARVPVP